jgi:hypothetical protein
VVEEQYTGQIATYPMSISNIGINILDWALINEAPIALSQPAALPEYVSGLYAPSAGAAPSDGSGVVSRGTSNPINPLSSKVRSWNESNGPYFTLFDIESPGIVPSVGTFTGTGAFIGAGEYVNGLSYMIDGSNNLFVVDDTGMLQAQYMADAPPNGETYSGMALDPTTGNVYASSTNVSSSTLYTFDVLTGSAITVGSIINSPGTIALSFDRAGNLFGYDIINDMFMQIDSATGSTSNMVPLPFDANFGQGMGYDSATGLLYILAFNNGTFQAELWTVDTSDPAMPEFAFIGVLGSSVPGGLNQLPWGGTDICNPVDIPWLDVSPTSGTTGAGLSSMVDVTIDATSLVPGVYTSTLCINSNDAVSPVVRVPLTLTIEEAPIIYLPVVFNNYTNYFSGPEQEPNDTSAQANGPLQPGQAYTGFPDDDRDYFSFATHSPGNINVALSNYTGQGGQLQLFYQSTANRVGFDADAPYNITYQGQPGTYFVLIFTESGFINTPYSLVVNAPQ